MKREYKLSTSKGLEGIDNIGIALSSGPSGWIKAQQRRNPGYPFINGDIPERYYERCEGCAIKMYDGFNRKPLCRPCLDRRELGVPSLRSSEKGVPSMQSIEKGVKITYPLCKRTTFIGGI